MCHQAGPWDMARAEITRRLETTNRAITAALDAEPGATGAAFDGLVEAAGELRDLRGLLACLDALWAEAVSFGERRERARQLASRPTVPNMRLVI